MPMDGVERRLAAILSADVVGYSRLMAADEQATVRSITAYRTEISNLVGDHRGRVVDATGDNVLAEFPTALDAVEAAVEIQAVLKARNERLPDDRRMEFRIGVHMGDVTVEDERIYGDGVNIAARLQGLAEPGGICISGAVHEQVRSKLRLAYDDLGEQSVKNMPESVRVFRILEEPSAERLATARVTTDRPSIVVLPFADMSPEKDQEYFCDGMAEEVINALTQLRELHVVARTSAFSFKGRNIDVREIGEKLGVRSVLEGSVRKAGDRLRVTAQLINVDDGYHVWSDRFDRRLDDVFAVQDEIASNIVDALKVEMAVGSPRAGRVRQQRNQEAYDLYLIARARFMAQTAASLEEALELIERVIALDPGFSRAHSFKAVTLLFMAILESDASRTRAALEAIQKAVELDPDDGRARARLGEISATLWDWENAERHGRRAIEIEPSGVEPHACIVWFLAATGRTAEAVEEIALAQKQDPVNPILSRNYGLMLYLYRRYERAVRQLRTALDIRPDLSATSLYLLEAYWAKGDRAEAVARLQQIYRGRSGSEPQVIERLHSESGPEGVLRWWTDHLETEANAADVLQLLGVDPRFVRAVVYALLGETDAAFPILETLVDEHSALILTTVARPSFDTLREDPRFGDILRRMGLEAFYGAFEIGLSIDPPLDRTAGPIDQHLQSPERRCVSPYLADHDTHSSK